MSSAAVNDVSAVAVAVGWSVFGVVWLVGAVYNARRAPAATRLSRFGSGGIIIGVVGVTLWKLPPALPRTEQPVVHLAGIPFMVAGVAIAVWARVTLGTMWSAVPEVKVGHELRTDGPYAWVRHPIYTGMLAMLVGTGLLAGLGPWLAIVPVAVAVFEVKLRVEERFMTATFPDAYPAYRQRVPQLVPYRRPR